MSIFDEIESDPRLREIEQTLQKLNIERLSTSLALRDGDLSPKEGERRLEEIDQKVDSIRQGKDYQRWQEAHIPPALREE